MIFSLVGLAVFIGLILYLGAIGLSVYFVKQFYQRKSLVTEVTNQANKLVQSNPGGRGLYLYDGTFV